MRTHVCLRVCVKIGGLREGRMSITQVKFHHLQFHRGRYKLDFRFPQLRALHISICI